MSTILKALKKAEEGMARNTLPGKILAADPAHPLGDMRAHARRRTVVLLSLLAVAAGLLYYMYYMRPGDPGAAVTPTEPARPALSVPTVAPVKEDHRGKDGAPPSLRLSGVLWDETKPIAILNGKPLTVGEEVDGARVVKIDLDGVKVRYNGREYVLSVE
jgi:hypothetical protein